MKIGYLDCFSGISGDMFLGALVDAGVPLAVLEAAVNSLGLDASLQLQKVDRSGISSTKINVLTADGKIAETAQLHEHSHTDDHDHDTKNGPDSHGHQHSHHTHADAVNHNGSHIHGRSLAVIQKMIRNSSLGSNVQQTALKAFQLLGAAEAKIHNVPIETIHFHEVGAVDAIVDMVAASAGCHWLQIDQWMCSPLNVGGGHVHCVHGKFPVPAPATLELLRDLPAYSSGVQKELVTPTGAALLRALDVKPSAFPAMRMHATGYGAGSRDLPGQPNVLRLVIGESTPQSLTTNAQDSAHKELIGVIETTIDDATPELLSYVADRLLAAGASDVLRTPVLMKKGRSGIQLTVMCSPDRAAALQQLIFQETTTLGLRYREETKYRLERSFVTVETSWGNVQVKVGRMEDGTTATYAPEYEDCRKLAEKYSVPLKTVMQTAVSAFLSKEQVAGTERTQETMR